MDAYYDVVLNTNTGAMSIYDILDRKKNKPDNNIRSYIVKDGMVYFYKESFVRGLDRALIAAPINAILCIMPIEED